MIILLPKAPFIRIQAFVVKHLHWFVALILTLVSAYSFAHYYHNGLGLSYNDARSHLDIGRRVVEGLKPGLAQLGSVWLPLTHLLMVPTIWNDFMWHSGLAGAAQSMLAYIGTGVLIYKFLERLKIGALGRIIGVIAFASNPNILYLQSTAMTELLLIATMTAAAYEFMLWYENETILDLIKASFFIMLSTLIRYDGWFLLLFCIPLIFIRTIKKYGYQRTEGTLILFGTLAGLGIALWFLWNQLIFKDALYFAFGPFSAHSQQNQLESAGVLVSKHNLEISTKTYLLAVLHNSFAVPIIMALLGLIALVLDKTQSRNIKLASLVLFSPLLFNIIALYLGHSVLFIPEINGESLFNIRYGIMLMPTIAIFVGFLIGKSGRLKTLLAGIFMFMCFIANANHEAVTIDDARVGSSQKNVSEVSIYLAQHAKDQPGFILISAASHDAIIFSSGLPMKRFIHEGTGSYWEAATLLPDHWARWIVMRTYDDNDLTWKFVSKRQGFAFYNKVGSYPFADIYELKPEYVPQLITTPIFTNQK